MSTGGVASLLCSRSWFASALLPFLDAVDYTRLQRVCAIAQQAPAEQWRAWAHLALRDFPRVDWPRVRAAVVHRRPASLYRIVRTGDRVCLLCGEPLWGGQRPSEALIVICRCAGLPPLSYPYAHTCCADDPRPRRTATGLATVLCRICGRRRPAVPVRIYS